MRIVTHKDICYDNWVKFVLEHPHGSVFHTPFALKLFEGVYGHDPFGLFLVDDNENIVSLLTGDIQSIKKGPLSVLSKRLVSYASPIFSNDCYTEALEIMRQYIDSRAGIYSEIRSNYFDPNELNHFLSAGFSFEDHLNIIIDLHKDKETLWKEVHSKRRNEIRKAMKEGLVVRPFSFEGTQEAYDILQEVYNRARLPLFPVKFFFNGFSHSCELASMRGFGVYLDKKMLGCMITLCFNGTIYDLYAGSYSQYYSMNPNDLIPWEVLMWGKQHGYKFFDFGGAGKPNKPYGVRNYKIKFGGDIVNHGRYLRIKNKYVYKMAEFGFKALQRLSRI